MSFYLASFMMAFSLVYSGAGICMNKVLRVKADLKLAALRKGTVVKSFSEKIWISADSPIKEALQVSANVNKIPSFVVYSCIKDFSTGLWTFLDPFMPLSSLAVDADDPAWDILIKKFNQNYAFEDKLKREFDPALFEKFMMNLNRFIRENIDSIDNLCVRLSDDYGPECRHYSMFLAVLFSKITKNLNLAWHSTIRVVGANVFNPKYTISEGHVWNLIKVKTATSKFYWIDDAMNRTTIALAPVMDMNCVVRKTDGAHNIIKKDEWWYSIVTLTLDKFFIGDRKDNFYDEKNSTLLNNYCKKAFSIHKDKINRRVKVIKRKRDIDDQETRNVKRRIDFTKEAQEDFQEAQVSLVGLE